MLDIKFLVHFLLCTHFFSFCYLFINFSHSVLCWTENFNFNVMIFNLFCLMFVLLKFYLSNKATRISPYIFFISCSFSFHS